MAQRRVSRGGQGRVQTGVESGKKLRYSWAKPGAEEADEKLMRLKEFHAQDGERSGELAQALRDYAALAEELKPRILEEDEDFDPAHIAEARKLADQLAVEAPAAQATAEAQQKGRELTRTRNKLLHLLVNQLRTVRRAAARVFERHPAIQREVTSVYERRRRAEARRRKRQEQPA